MRVPRHEHMRIAGIVGQGPGNNKEVLKNMNERETLKRLPFMFYIFYLLFLLLHYTAFRVSLVLFHEFVYAFHAVSFPFVLRVDGMRYSERVVHHIRAVP